MRTYAIVCFCFSIATLKAQSFDDVIAANRYIDCRDVTFNATSIIGRLYSHDQIDSIYQFLNYWKKKCGNMESIFRLRNILDIKTGRFDPDSISNSWIELLIAYRRSLEITHNYIYAPDRVQHDLLAEKNKFDSLTRQIAFGTLSDNIDGSLILDFYSDEAPSFGNIKSASEESRLRALHQKSYIRTFRRPQGHIAFATGLVLNYGNISIFGTRPNFGIVMGGKVLRHNYDAILDFRAGPSKENYSFIYQDSLITKNTWTGMYAGLEYTYDFVTTSKVDVGISPGIGYDRITTLTMDNEYGEDAAFLSSFNKNIGVVFKYKFGRNGGYLGLHLRYNWTNYKNPGGTPLDGEYLNIRLTIGSIADFLRDARLRNLE